MSRAQEPLLIQTILWWRKVILLIFSWEPALWLLHSQDRVWLSKKCLNVRQKLGTWKFFNVFLRFPMFSNVFQCYLLSFSLSLSLTLSLFLTLTLFQSLIESLLTCWTTFVFISMLKSHSHTLSLSHSHTLLISHSITLDMPNNFCFHVYAQTSLFIGENVPCVFGPHHHPLLLVCQS